MGSGCPTRRNLSYLHVHSSTTAHIMLQVPQNICSGSDTAKKSSHVSSCHSSRHGCIVSSNSIWETRCQVKMVLVIKVLPTTWDGPSLGPWHQSASTTTYYGSTKPSLGSQCTVWRCHLITGSAEPHSPASSTTPRGILVEHARQLPRYHCN